MAYKNILVGIDGSKRAERAFETAVDLAKVFSAKLYLVWVVNRDRGIHHLESMRISTRILPNVPKNSCRSI